MNINKKTRNNALILLANKALRVTNVLFKCVETETIADSYNGQIAALSVSIAMTGLKPALAIYYQDKGERNKVNRRAILTVIAKMITLDESFPGEFDDAKALYNAVVQMPEVSDNELDNRKWKEIKTEIIDCSIALKQVVRTYNLEKS